MKYSILGSVLLIALLNYSNVFMDKYMKKDKMSIRGTIHSISQKEIINKDEINVDIESLRSSMDTEFTFNAEYDVRSVNIDYYTKDQHNEIAIVSARVYLPTTPNNRCPIVVINHPTILKTEYAPTNIGNMEGFIYASTGYIAVVPDYIGYGSSTAIHPYLLADASASTVIDSIVAAKELANNMNIETNKNVFITGYSQGGYVTMATALKVQSNFSNKFSLTAVAPNAGVYDLVDTIKALAVTTNMDKKYIPIMNCMITAYDDAYDLEKEVGKILTEEKSTSNYFTKNFVKLIQSKGTNKAIEAFESNSVYKWVPRMKMRLHHCKSDTTTAYKQSSKAVNYFKSKGVKSIDLIDPKENANHSQCYWPSQIRTKIWFDSLNKG